MATHSHIKVKRLYFVIQRMQVSGRIRRFTTAAASQRTSSDLLLAFCRPFLSVATDTPTSQQQYGIWSKHDLDLKFKQMDKK